jgi:hypothetical protein
MKRLLLLLLLAFPLYGQNFGQVQNPLASTLYTSSSNCLSTQESCVWQRLPNNAYTTTINVAGTFTATLTIEESNNGGVTWISGGTTTTVGTTTYQTNGFTDLRVRCSAYTSGSMAVTITTGSSINTSSSASSASASLGAAINVKNSPYNAVGDGKIFVDGVTNSGNNQITSATAIFSASDATTPHSIYCVISGGTAWNAGQTAVASFVNSSTITYSGANASVQSGLVCHIWNNADSAAITSAFNACLSQATIGATSLVSYQYQGCSIYIPSGLYGLAATLDNQNGPGTSPCVGIFGDGSTKTILMPAQTFTQASAHPGWFINDRCYGALLKDFTIDVAYTYPSGINSSSGGVIQLASPNGHLLNVAVYDQCYIFGGFAGSGGLPYGLYIGSGTNMVVDHFTAVNNGACTGGSEGGMNILSSEMDVYSPFLSNTLQNLWISGIPNGSNGSGVRVFGGVIDEGSITQVSTSQQTSFYGTILTGGANCLALDSTSIVRYTGGYCGTFGSNTGGGPNVASGGQLLLTDVDVRAQNAGSSCYTAAAAGGIVNVGGNLCTIAGGGTIYGTGSFVNSASLTHTYPEPFLPALPTSGTAQTIAAFTPVTGVSVINFTIVSSNTPTCATPPTFQITNGTQTITQTFASSSNISGPTSPTQTITNNYFPAGTQITMAITTAAYACTTAPVNMNFAIEWQSVTP